MMSRPAALSFFALSATSMMALGLARLMRSASWSIDVPRQVRWGAQNSSISCAAPHNPEPLRARVSREGAKLAKKRHGEFLLASALFRAFTSAREHNFLHVKLRVLGRRTSQLNYGERTMLHLIWSIIIGFIIGLIARAIMPGVDHMGF